MSESYEIFLEASEHGTVEMASTDASVAPDGIAEHGDGMPGATHSVHSHPPITFILTDLSVDNPTFVTAFDREPFSRSVSILRRPPLAPPKA